MIKGQILPSGIGNPAIISAFSEIPRDRFLPDSFQKRAYSDAVVPLGGGRLVLAPMVIARMMAAANIVPTDHLLTIGCGTGYMGILLSLIGGDVVGIDTNPQFIEKATALGGELSRTQAHFKVAPLTLGYAPMAPYDGIFIEGSVPYCPAFIEAQLSPGGRAVMFEKPTPGPLWAQAVLYHKKPTGMTRTTLFTLPVPHLLDFYPEGE